MSKIFISLASFVDPYLVFTLTSACKMARNPQNLVFGVVDQHPENRRQLLKKYELPAEIRYVNIDPVESRGVCWARSIAFSFYQQETYFLQVDSHTYFEQDWDENLINQFSALCKQSAKPILSVYPFGFEFENDLPVVKTKIGHKTTLAMRPKPDEELTEENPVLHFRAEHVFTREPIPGFHLAGGFIFTRGQFVNEIPYDPRLYFHGEEQNLSIRAYTHGWDIFHPPVIPLYHLYKVPNNAYVAHHWHQDWQAQRDYHWNDLRNLAMKRLADLVYHQKNLGAFGLGSERSLEDFAKFSGIDYQKRTIDRSRYKDRLE